MVGLDDEAPPPPPPPQTPQQQTPHTVSTIKLPILKKGEYDVWAMKMEHYLAHTDILYGRLSKREMVLYQSQRIKLDKFGGNDESKKMQKYILKQQFEGFSVSNSEGLHKGYDRFQSLLSQLEIHGAGVSNEDVNQKFLMALPPYWSQTSFVLRTKPGLDSLSFDDLYNNLRAFEFDVKGSDKSSTGAQNVAFVSSESTNSTNNVSTAYSAFTSSNYNSNRENSSSYADEVMHSFFATQSNGPQFNHKDLEQIDESKGSQDARRKDVGNYGYKAKDNERRSKKKVESKALLTLDGEGIDWTAHAEVKQEDFALMAHNNSGSDTEVLSYSNECKESYANLKQLYDEQREQLGVASIKIQAYEKALKKKLLEEAEKEKEELKARVKGWQHSAKTVFHSVFDTRSSDLEDTPENDRYVEGMHVVPPLLSGTFIPPRPNREIDELQFTYGPNPSNSSDSDARSSDFNSCNSNTSTETLEVMSESVVNKLEVVDFDSCESNSSIETLESVPEPIVNEPKVVSKPKVWSDAPIIEEYKSDSDDEYVIKSSKEQEKPSFAFVNTVKHVKSPRETVKEQNTCNKSPKADKKDWNGFMSKKLGLGYRFSKKACFVCGSFGHLIKDCDFYEKRMAKQLVPSTVLTRTGRIPVNTARHKVSSKAVSTNTVRKVNIVSLIVNDVKPRNVFHKSHSPTRRPFYRTTAPKAKFSNQKVNTDGDKAVSAVGSIRETAEDPHKALKNKGIVDSRCFRHMTGNKAYLVDYQDYNGGPVAFGGSKGYITGKGKIRTGKLDFEDVCFVKELQLSNLFSVSQMCDKKNKVLFTDTECLVLSPDFKLPDENQVLLRVPKQNNMYNFNLENIVPTGGLACLITKATVDESNKWHRRLGHVNFKNLNKLVKGNLCSLSLDKLAMPPHLYRKFCMGVTIATGCRGYYKPGTRAWVNRGSRKIRIPVDMYPCRVEERLTIKLVKGEEVLKIKTTVTAKDGTITKFLGKFPGYKPTKEEEEISKLKAIYEDVIYDISDSDSDLESTARSGPRNSEMEDTGSSGMRINA
ncbi:putative ribonuclease H-like domain-containing protein [Tanacetum coccineum]